MKIMKQMMSLAAAILALSGCSSEDDILSAYHNNPDAVHITAEVGKASADGFTRSNPLGTPDEQKKFNDGDMISVKADGQEAVTYKLDGTEWQPQSGKFLKWESESMNFTAYYPATFDGNITQPTSYPDEASLIAADYMSFTDDVKNPGDNSLTLNMNRQMARVVVEIKGFNNQYDKNTTVNSVTINGTVKALKHDGKFYALMVPCEKQDNNEFLSLEVAEGESKTTETLTTTPATFEAGKSYTFQLTVGKNKVVVSGITVADWNTGKITDDGKAELYVPYVTFTAEAEQKFKMTTTGNYDLSDKFQYSVNFGKWEDVVADKEVTFGGDKGNLRLRGTNPYGTAPAGYAYSTITFTEPTVNVACTGDIRTLLDWRNYATVATNQARFLYLFYGCKVLTSAPKLPATNLANYCYNGMFSGCTKLESAPELPATTLARSCYESMFSGCTKLTSAPALPAKELATSCYSSMFSNCTNLESAPALPAEKLAYDCYYGMFNGCTKLTSAPALPAKELATSCYGSMFSYCTNLESAPKLSAETLADDCYSVMFYGCTNLSSVTMLAPNDQITTAENCCFNWLYNAGTDPSVTSRTLKVQDKGAYEALKANTDYLPAIWKKGSAGTTVLNASNNPIE